MAASRAAVEAEPDLDRGVEKRRHGRPRRPDPQVRGDRSDRCGGEHRRGPRRQSADEYADGADKLNRARQSKPIEPSSIVTEGRTARAFPPPSRPVA